MRLGACDYLTKPFDIADLLKMKVRERWKRVTASGKPDAQAALGRTHQFSNIIGRQKRW